MKKERIKNNIWYLWNDYKWLLMAGLVVAALAIHLLFAALLKKDAALCVMLVDAHTPVSESDMQRDALAALGLDPGKYSATFSNSLMFSDTDSGNYAMASLSRFLADIGSEKLDVCAMREDDFKKYDESGTWADLAALFGEAGMSVADEAGLLLADEAGLPVLDEEDLLVADGRVIGIYADALPGLEKYECYPQEDCRGVVGIVYNAPHPENAVRYLAYLGQTGDGSLFEGE